MTTSINSYWDLLEPEFEKVNIYEGPDVYFASCNAVSPLIVHLYATHMCASEVHNGGFLQLFWNNTGIAVPEAIEGYALFGMTKLSASLDSAARLLGTTYPRDRDERWDALLVASGLDAEQLESIFKKHDDLYHCFTEATQPLNFDSLEREFWKLAEEENGGYGVAATLYAQKVSSQS
jgi:Domain of unknown function (DUF4375)